LLSVIDADRTAHQKTSSGPDSGPPMAPDGGSGQGSNDGADGRTPHARVDGCLASIATSDLILSVLTALGVIATKLLEALAASGECSHTRTGRNGGASGDQKQRRDDGEGCN